MLLAIALYTVSQKMLHLSDMNKCLELNFLAHPVRHYRLLTFRQATNTGSYL